MLMLACNVVFNIVKEKITAGLMKALSNMYEKTFVTNKQLKVLIENETSKTIKYVRTGNSMEFCSELLNKLYMKEGIVRHYTNTGESQHDAESMSRTLLETAHKMLSSVNMARRFLTDALNTASYLMNRSPSTALNVRLQKKYGQVMLLNIPVIRIFDRPYYIRVSDGKLDERVRKCMSLGYE